HWEGRRALPVPLSWHLPKEDESDLHDFAVEQPAEDRAWQQARGTFRVPLEEGVVTLLRPEREGSIHPARNRRLGRPRPRGCVRKGEDPGAVYHYEALAGGQTFAAAVLCEDDDVAVLRPLLEVPALLGGARSGGFGRARLHSAAVHSDWVEEP